MHALKAVKPRADLAAFFVDKHAVRIDRKLFWASLGSGDPFRETERIAVCVSAEKRSLFQANEPGYRYPAKTWKKSIRIAGNSDTGVRNQFRTSAFCSNNDC
ncbi:hypothetical protein [Paenibacillus sp. GYB003]|uniref:hypothetical protein n=1 Tax=Paenibacillus sp. GYB003 TaxID=2994392 RepID=UPI002F96C523